MAGIYIHIPFCRQACTYCDFHFSTSTTLKADLVNCIVNEIKLADNFIDPLESIGTIYFGGGTPSLLTINELELIFAALHEKFRIEKDVEITLEANPDDINRGDLKQWQRLGINRLSLGVQSFNEEELKWMNRAHNARQSLESIDEIRDSGFDNFSVDLIFGSPLLTDEELMKNLQIITDKKIPHVSCYALTVEPRTILNKLIEQKKSLPVDSEKQARQFILLMKVMSECGYQHYEISNFSMAGMQSKHNSSYWEGKAYYGFGPSAHAFDGDCRRRWNISNNALYMQSLKMNVIPFEEEVLNSEQKLNEYVMTSLRTISGIDTRLITSKFGSSHAERLFSVIRKYIDSNLVQIQDEHIVLTNEGKLFADGIAADLFI